MPDNVRSYKKTPVFDENTVPSGLLRDHSTLKGVWGKIVVLEGELLYVIQGPPEEKLILSTEHAGVVEPEKLHYIKPLGPVKFYVDFHK